jgi:lipoprotein-releasing system permease protein
MFQPYYAFIGYRYTRAKRKNHFISFIALTAMIGIALGVAVLITVLSVMNGFSREIRTQMLNGAPHITVQSFDGQSLLHWDSPLEKIKHFPGVLDLAPYIQGQGMLSHSGRIQGVWVKGIAETQQQVFPLNQYLIAGDMDAFKAGGFGIYLGKQLALSLNLQVGDKVTLIVPEAQVSLAGVSPRLKRFTLLGIFEMGTFSDSTYAFIHLDDAAKLFRYSDHRISGIQLKVNDELNAASIANKLRIVLGNHYEVSDWMQSNGSYLSAIQMEKTVMTFILLLIVAIAAFNLVSGLVMLVTDKRPDIAILRTLGARAHQVMGIFMVQGSIIGIMGIAIGLILGVTLALNVTDWVNWIERTFHIRLFQKEVYAVSCLPSQLQWSDVVEVCMWSLGFSFISTLYPAYRASKIRPAEALRYE